MTGMVTAVRHVYDMHYRMAERGHPSLHPGASVGCIPGRHTSYGKSQYKNNELNSRNNKVNPIAKMSRQPVASVGRILGAVKRLRGHSKAARVLPKRGDDCRVL